MTGKPIRILAVALAYGAGLLLLPSAALADNMTFVGAYNPAAQMGGVYDSPYVITVNGQQVVAICDTYAQDVLPAWTANETGTIMPGGTQEFNGGTYDGHTVQTAYEAAEWLGSELLSPAILNDSTSEYGDAYYEVGVYSYAIWSIFDSAADSGLGGPIQTDVTNAINAAFATVTTPGYVGPTVEIYTPDPATTSQEFLVYTPEASATVTLALDVLALFGAVFLLRRRILWNSRVPR